MPSEGADLAFLLPKAAGPMSISSWTRRAGQAIRTLLLRRLMTPADGWYSTNRVTAPGTILADTSGSKRDLDAQVVQRFACHPTDEGTRFRKKEFVPIPQRRAGLLACHPSAPWKGTPGNTCTCVRAQRWCKCPAACPCWRRVPHSASLRGLFSVAARGAA